MKTSEKPDIRDLSLNELMEFFTRIGEKTFRAKQVYEWLWKKCARSFNEMTNLSKPIRLQLAENYTFQSVTLNSFVQSADETIKCAFRLYDGKLVEGVLIPTENRVTACISSQVGCALDCQFCATGKLGFSRNLHFAEIFDQVAMLTTLSVEKYGIPLSNIVYMGMGEPLLNYENVMKSVERITATDGLGMSPQRITVSTSGLPTMIQKLADDGARFNLALSLHSANDRKRSQMMPVNQKNPLPKLTEALKYYHQKTGMRISIEYILFGRINDSLADAKELAAFCRNFPVKVNIIEYNTVSDISFVKTTDQQLGEFVAFLESRNMVVNVRRSRGNDIGAACGQLANRLQN
ncbi:MAG: 23S rRNA (adenine(2503)-C(2))-methyltransferase RlmN [Lentimicrobiaceae bacterium]|nr:23S rRNA (adenine(2503)-C(2))-methyltransferase RlmN [Lentimicrobiaceae bacterium]